MGEGDPHLNYIRDKEKRPPFPPLSEGEGQGGGQKAPEAKSSDRPKFFNGHLNARQKTSFRKNLRTFLVYKRTLITPSAPGANFRLI